MKGWYNGAQVVEESLALLGIDTKEYRYEEAVMYFARCYRNYQMYHAVSLTKTWLPVSPIRTIALPDDFMEMGYVGVSLNGEVFTFTNNSNMATPSAPMEDKLLTERNETDSIWAENGATNLYSYYVVDEKKRRIELREPVLRYYEQSPVGEVLLGYISNGLEDLNSSYVPAKAVNMITTDIAYNLSMSSKIKDWNLINALKRNLQEETLRFDALSLPSTDELLDMLYSTSSAGLRR